MDEVALEPTIFFRTTKVRELLFIRNRPASPLALARFLKRDFHELRTDCERLEQAGLATRCDRGYQLTDDGQASLRWSAPPPPDGVIRTPWVSALARAIAEHYRVEVLDMLRVEIGHGVVARSRLCFALWSRGWQFERIEEHFAFPPGWARRAVERWKRMRDELPPRSGPELRAWRERHGLSQIAAARRLGISRRSYQRSELAGVFNAKMALGRT